MKKYVFALDQGTTSSRAILFDGEGQIIASAQHPFEQIYPQPGWVEHDPMTILHTQLLSLAEAFEKSGVSAQDIAGIGITNQRETTIVWEKATGKPVYNAIVWQCRRTAPYCEKLKAQGWAEPIRQKTGLLIDAYFSGTKLRWILDNVPGAQERAERGELLFGTVESWLIWNLTGGKAHVSDMSNASRTMLFNLHTLDWDKELCDALHIPMQMLPKIVGNSEEYGVVDCAFSGLEALRGIPICGAAGDQQSALLGQGCIKAGDSKNTYGTGCFTMMNTGETPAESKNGLLTCVAWSVGGKVDYCLEGSVFNAGSTVQWLKNEMELISSGAETEALACSVPDNGGVYLVSAFTGLGAPHWDMYARGTIVGITRGTTRAHIVRAGLEGIAYQVRDLITAMEQDCGSKLDTLRVDGGVSVNNFLMQFQSDILRCAIDRPAIVETTALGAAFLAGLHAGVWKDISDIASLRRSERIFSPEMDSALAEKYCERWKKAVERAGGWE